MTCPDKNRGSFIHRHISLAIGQQGRITQRVEPVNIRVPRNAADESIFLKVEDRVVERLFPTVGEHGANSLTATAGVLGDFPIPRFSP